MGGGTAYASLGVGPGWKGAPKPPVEKSHPGNSATSQAWSKAPGGSKNDDVRRSFGIASCAVGQAARFLLRLSRASVWFPSLFQGKLPCDVFP